MNPLSNPFAPQNPGFQPAGFQTGGTLEGAYGAFWIQFEAPLREASQSLQAVGLDWMLDMLTPILVIVTMTWGAMLATGTMSMHSARKYGARVLLMLWLIVGGGWSGTINQLVLEDFPNEVAQRIHGGSVTMQAVEQFDTIDQVIKGMAATALAQATGPLFVAERAAVHVARAFAGGFEAFMFFIWCAMRMLLYMVVVTGSFLLIFIPFDSTIVWFRQNIGKIVGLSVWQLCANLFLKVLLTGTMMRLDRLTNAQVQSLGNIIDTLWDVTWWNMGCAILFLLLPAAAAYGSSVVSSAGVVQGMVIGIGAAAIGGVSRVAGGLASATNRTVARLGQNG